jgi:hypothetical protein
MTTDDDIQRPGGAGKAIEETWNRLRQDDPDAPAEDEVDLEQIADDLDRDDDTALDGEVMDDPVDTVGSDPDPTYDPRDPAGLPPARNPF